MGEPGNEKFGKDSKTKPCLRMVHPGSLYQKEIGPLNMS